MSWRFAMHHNRKAIDGGVYPFGHLLSRREALTALAHIRTCPSYAPTPLHELPGAARRAGVRKVFYKDEGGRFALGSFKALGGAYAVACVLQDIVAQRFGQPVPLTDIAKGRYAQLTRGITVATASDGNHGRAVAAGALHFRCKCVVFLHEGVSAGREAAIVGLGGQVVRTPGTYDDSVREAERVAAAQGWRIVADTANDPAAPVPLRVMQGYATLAIEALEQLLVAGEPFPTHVFVQGGVGGLAAAVTAHFWEEAPSNQRPTIVVVEPERADCLYQSALAGKPAPASGDLETIMAGLSCGEVSQVAWPILRAGVEGFATVEDRAAVDCMRLLREGALGGPSIVAGESGAAGLAGLLAVAADRGSSATLRLGPESTVLLIGTEGATDPEIYRSLLGDTQSAELI